MIHCDYYGNPSNPPLLILHGAGALDTFANQYFLAEKYYLIVPHLPGAGINAGVEYNMKETVSLLLQLTDEIKCEKIAVMGHSLGAQLAAAMIFTRPEKFSCGVLLSPWLIPDKKSVSLYTSLAGMTSAMLRWKWLIKQTVEKLAENKNITAEILPRCSHDFPMRKHRVLNPVLTEFFDKNIL